MYRNFKGPGKGRLGPSRVGIISSGLELKRKTDFFQLFVDC